MGDYEDELADLIGDVEPEPPDAFDNIDELLAAAPDVRDWALRKLVLADPMRALPVVFPEYSTADVIQRASEYRRQRAQRHVRAQLDAEEARQNAVALPDLVPLSKLLAEPDEEVTYRVGGLWPTGGRVLLAAQAKAGKTTLTNNLVRSLVDGDAFLGQFDVEPAERVVIVDNEMSSGQTQRWLRRQGIRNTDAVEVVNLRGQPGAFNILDPGIRAEWARLIGPADVLVFDCLRPALDALGLSEDKEAGRFVTALDELCFEAGVSELMLVHHMGHTNERARGDSRLGGWSDSNWKLVLDEAGSRYLWAEGRDVDQPEVQLTYDTETSHLTVSGGSRTQATHGRIENAVQVYVAEHPGCSQNEIERNVEGDDKSVRAAIKELVGAGWLRTQQEKQKRAHFANDPTHDFAETS